MGVKLGGQQMVPHNVGTTIAIVAWLWWQFDCAYDVVHGSCLVQLMVQLGTSHFYKLTGVIGS